MSARVLAISAALVLEAAAHAGPADVQGAPDDERARLVGHDVRPRAGGGYELVDVAGLGRPIVGVIALRADAWGDSLWLEPVAQAGSQDAGGPPRRLLGALAVPRLLAPGYKVWVLPRSPQDSSLSTIEPIRFGVLARPTSRPASGTTVPLETP